MRQRGILLIIISLVFIVFLSGCTSKVNRVIPKSATPGSVIVLKGFWFGKEPGEADVYFGDIKADITFWSKREIAVKVPKGTGSTEIFIEKDGKMSKGSAFTFLEEEYDLVGETKTTESGAVLEVDGAAVTVPPGIIENGIELKISEVSNAPLHDEDLYMDSQVYNVEMENYTSFDDFIMIELDLEKGMTDSNYITAAYWDENINEWVQAPSYHDVENKTVRIYTNHLTNWRLLALKKIYDVHETKHFLIAYNKRDKTDVSNITAAKAISDLADRIGDALDDSYLKYSSVIGEKNSPRYYMLELDYVAATLNPNSWFKDNKEVIDTRLIVRMSSSYNKAGAEYSWATGQLMIPTKYSDEKDLKTTAAHELFHSFQNYKLSVLQMGEARWLMEAMAEYGSYYVGNSYSLDKLHTYAALTKNLEYFENREDGHEYGMSAYIKYLVGSGADFGNMWNAVVAGKSDPAKAFDTYVESATGKSNHTNYRIFWQKVVTDSSMPNFSISGIGVRAKSVGIGSTLKTSLSIKNEWSMAALITQPKAFNSDGSRTLIIEAEDLPSSAYMEVFRVSGFDKKTASHDRVSGGTSALGSIGSLNDYLAVDFIEGMNQIIYITAFDGEKGSINIKVSDISVKLNPDELKDAQPLKQYKFQATAANIPESIRDITVKWYLNDGTLIEKTDYTNKSGRISDKILFEFEEGNLQDIVVTFEDSSNGQKITSGRIKVNDTEILHISYEPAEPKVMEGVEFSTTGDKGWYYKWDTGVTGDVSGQGLTETTDAYGKPGRYQVQVTAYSDPAMTKTVGYGTVVVPVEDLKASEEPAPTIEPTPTPAANSRWISFSKDDYLPGESMSITIESSYSSATSYESVNYYSWSGKSADEETKAANIAAFGKDYSYENKSGSPYTLAPEVPGNYEITGIFVQDPDITISGQYVVKDGTDGYWQRILYEDKESKTYDTTTTSNEDSRIKTRTIINSTALTFHSTRTTSYPDGKIETEEFDMAWSDLPEMLIPGETITLNYSSYYEGEQNHYQNKTGLAVFYNGLGNGIGILSPTSYAVADGGNGNATVQFEVPAYGYVGNATRSLELGSGMNLYTEEGDRFIYDNYLYLIRAVYQYTEDGEVY